MGNVQHRTSNVQHPMAFTLIELLIVTAILGVVIGAIGACLAGGIRVWDSARTFNLLERDGSIGLAVMEKDLMNALPIHAIGFEGREDAVKFPALLTAGDDVQVGSVEYSFDEYDRALVRREWSYEGVEVRKERLMENVEDVAMTYFRPPEGDEATWKERDAPATNFPGKVEVALSLADDERTFNFAKTILLPVREQP